MTDTPNDEDAEYWAEVQESPADAQREYQHINPELIELMKSNEYFNGMISQPRRSQLIHGGVNIAQHWLKASRKIRNWAGRYLGVTLEPQTSALAQFRRFPPWQIIVEYK